MAKTEPRVEHKPNIRVTANRAQAAAGAAVPEPEGFAHKAKFRKTTPSAKYPNGYETRRVTSEAQEAALGEKWKDSPEGMMPEYPFTHQE